MGKSKVFIRENRINIFILIFLFTSIFVSFYYTTKQEFATVTITLWDPYDRVYTLFYDDPQTSGYPFSDKYIITEHEGQENISTIIFEVPSDKTRRLRLDIPKIAAENFTDIVYLYGIEIDSPSRNKTVSPEGLYFSFSTFPEAEKLLAEDCVILNFIAPTVIFEATKEIAFSNIIRKWNPEYTTILISCLFFSISLWVLVNSYISFERNVSIRYKNNLRRLILSLLTSMLILISIAIMQYKNCFLIFDWIKCHFIYSLLTFVTIFSIHYFVMDIIGFSVTTILISMITAIIAITNYIKIEYRGMPFLPVDLLLIGEVKSIVSGLNFKINSYIWVGVLILIVATIGFSYLSSKLMVNKHLTLKQHWKGILLKGVLLAVFITITYFSKIGISSSSFDPENDYSQKGIVVGFLSNVKTLISPHYNDYSKENILSISKKVQMTQRGQTSAIKPNIIMVMSESLWDIESLPNVRYEQEIFPTLNALKAGAISGTLLTSVYGGGTSITEFEVLTGFTKQFLPLEITPYYQLKCAVDEKFFSIAQYLKEQGYETMAMHPFIGTNYNWNNVYPNLGFNSFITSDDFKNPESKRSFISDSEMVNKMIDEYTKHLATSESPFFLFAVSVQNHPDYSEDRWSLDELINVEAPSLSENAVSGLKDLATGLYYSDLALKKLIDFFSNQTDPTIVILFGDHMSKVGNSAYEIFEDTGLISKSDAEFKKQYIEHRTPFVAWSNYNDLNLDVGVIGSSNLLPVVFNSYRLDRPLWFDFLYDVYKVSPGYSLNVVLHNNGTYSPDMSEEEKMTYRKYELLQYDYLYGEKYSSDLFK